MGPPTCMFGLTHVLYDSYGPPYLIWNRYLPLPFMEQVLYGSPLNVCMVPPHVKCLHVLYDSYGPHIPYMEEV